MGVRRKVRYRFRCDGDDCIRVQETVAYITPRRTYLGDLSNVEEDPDPPAGWLKTKKERWYEGSHGQSSVSYVTIYLCPDCRETEDSQREEINLDETVVVE